MKNIKFFQCVNVIWSYLQSLLSVLIIIYPLQCAYELPLCMKFGGATRKPTKSAVTHFSLILSHWDVEIYKMKVSRWCVQILDQFGLKLLPLQLIEFFWVNQKSNFETLVFDHVLFKNFSNQFIDIIFLWYFNHT